MKYLYRTDLKEIRRNFFDYVNDYRRACKKLKDMNLPHTNCPKTNAILNISFKSFIKAYHCSIEGNWVLYPSYKFPEYHAKVSASCIEKKVVKFNFIEYLKYRKNVHKIELFDINGNPKYYFNGKR